MNFIITAKCNKGCDYCFARESRNKILKENEKTEMDLATFCTLLNKIPQNTDGHPTTVKLLGGEPTQHPQLRDFLEEIRKRKMKATIISNFLFKEEETLEMLKEYIHNGAIAGFLLNATDLDIKDRLETYAKNYNALYSLLYSMDREKDISPGITFSLDDEKTPQYYKDYVDLLSKKLLSMERMRISISFPGDSKDKEKFHFLHNKDYGLKLLTALNQLVEHRIVGSIDCVIYRCLFENKEEWKFVNKFARQVKSWCNGAPFDIFPDMTASKCYPLKESVKVNLNNYDNLYQAKEEVEERYKIIRNMVNYPEPCKNCGWFGKECEGPCLGYFDLNDVSVGVNL